MEISKRKALYLLLSSLLGMLLVLMFHRAVFVIYEILGDMFPINPILNIDLLYVAVADFFTMLLAMFFGSWYGIWLGMHWYKIIYEDRGFTSWFHGFVPHHWRSKPVKDVSATRPRTIVAHGKTSDGFRTMRPTRIEPVWSFEDFKKAEKPVAKKRVAKKTAAKKRVRKVAKKTAAPEIE